MIDKALLKMLVCPESKAPLKQVGEELICEKSQLAYPIQDGIPVLLISEAQALDDDERQRLDAKSGEETGPKTSEG